MSGDATLQRLFSTFPSGWPGAGLLLLRACLGAASISLATAGLSGPQEPLAFARDLIAAVGGALLIAGLWTPAMGVLLALDQIWIASLAAQREGAWLHILLAMLAASVAMLGPGAWSIDARLFGRKRFDIDRTGSRRSL